MSQKDEIDEIDEDDGIHWSWKSPPGRNKQVRDATVARFIELGHLPVGLTGDDFPSMAID